LAGEEEELEMFFFGYSDLGGEERRKYGEEKKDSHATEA